MVSDVRYTTIQMMNLVGFYMNTKDCGIYVNTKSSSTVIEADGTVKFDYVQAPNEHERINDPRCEDAIFNWTRQLIILTI